MHPGRWLKALHDRALASRWFAVATLFVLVLGFVSLAVATILWSKVSLRVLISVEIMCLFLARGLGHAKCPVPTSVARASIQVDHC